MTSLMMQNVTVGYGSVKVLKGLSLPAITTGQLVGVLGPNGAGKSTLLRAVAGLLGFSGSIELNGHSLPGIAHGARARQIGYLPQALPQVSSLIAYEVVLSACRAVQPDLSRSTAEANVERIFDQLGIRHLAFKGLRTLSGGQRQMIGLAQVLVRQPPVLLLDEPTSALDLRWQLSTFKIVRDVITQTGGLGLIALHDINLAMRQCDSVMLLSEGDALAFGAPADAITSETLANAYAIAGRVEKSSDGLPFVIADGPLPINETTEHQ